MMGPAVPPVSGDGALLTPQALQRLWRQYRDAIAAEACRPPAAAARGLSILVRRAHLAGVPWNVIGAGIGITGSEAELRYSS